MPLSVAKVPLELQIAAAFKRVRQAGKEDGADPDAIIDDLANQLALAINAYVTQAVVNVTLVNTAVIGASPTGPVVGTGIGIGSGILL
tara:strand:- start:95 stop:358 length:264 start_codon:yes stop_codon:yes gene_type:complete